MYKQRLLKRLNYFYNFPEKRLKTSNVSVEIDSIKEHLAKLLISKEKMGFIDNGYGLSDLSNMHNEHFDEFVIDLEKEVLEKIKQYESRLKDIKVNFLIHHQNNFNLQFVIQAVLKSDNHTNIFFNSTIYPEVKIDSDKQ